jgi:hypothetical protein
VLTLCAVVVQVLQGGMFGGGKVFGLCGQWYCESGADGDRSVLVYDAVQIGVQLVTFVE